MSKIIACDNFNRDYEPDYLINHLPYNLSKYDADLICEILIKYTSGDCSTWYKVVDDDYVLSKGMEDLV